MASPSRSAWNSIQSLPTSYSDIEDYNSDTDIEDDGTDMTVASSLTSGPPNLWKSPQHRVTPPPIDGPSSPKEFKLSTSLHFMKGSDLRTQTSPTTAAEAPSTPIAPSPSNTLRPEQTPSPCKQTCSCTLDAQAILLRLAMIEEKVEWSQHTVLNASNGLEQLARTADTLDVNIDAQKDSFLALNARLGDLHTLLEEVRNRGQLQEESCGRIEQTLKLVLDKTVEARDFAWGYGELGVFERERIEEGVELASDRIEIGGEAILDLKKQLFHGLWEIVEGIEKVDGRIHEAIVVIEQGEVAMNERIERVTEIVKGGETRGRQMERDVKVKRTEVFGNNSQYLARKLANKLDDNIRVIEEMLGELRLEKTSHPNHTPSSLSIQPASEIEDESSEDTPYTTEGASHDRAADKWSTSINVLNDRIGGLKQIIDEMSISESEEVSDDDCPAETSEQTTWNGLDAAEKSIEKRKQNFRTRIPTKPATQEICHQQCILARRQSTTSNFSGSQPLCSNYDLEINYDLFLENRHLRLQNEVLMARIDRISAGGQKRQAVQYWVNHEDGEKDWYEQALWPQGDPDERVEGSKLGVWCVLM